MINFQTKNWKEAKELTKDGFFVWCNYDVPSNYYRFELHCPTSLTYLAHGYYGGKIANKDTYEYTTPPLPWKYHPFNIELLTFPPFAEWLKDNCMNDSKAKAFIKTALLHIIKED